MRAILTGCAILALAACQPKIPDSAAGVGFDNAVLSPPPPAPVQTVAAVPPPTAVSEEAMLKPVPTIAASKPKPQSVRVTSAPVQTPQAKPPATASAVTAASARAAEPASPSRATPSSPQKTPDGVVHASPSNPAPGTSSNAGISDENDFAAVGSRRSIEDDAARKAQNSANYQLIQPTAVPARTNSGPNIVAFALSTTHAVGTQAYGRIGLTSKTRHAKACAKYPSSNEAQSAFLAKGGPKNDRLGLDPDGDGYACGWNPAPFRKAARGG